MDRRFSSTVDAGDGERAISSCDMETVRWLGGRKVADEANVGVGCSVKNSLDATQTPDTKMNRFSASSVSMGSFPVGLSMKEVKSMLEGVIGEGLGDERPGVDGAVADGIE
jgi:hypothetical protein